MRLGTPFATGDVTRSQEFTMPYDTSLTRADCARLVAQGALCAEPHRAWAHHRVHDRHGALPRQRGAVGIGQPGARLPWLLACGVLLVTWWWN